MPNTYGLILYRQRKAQTPFEQWLVLLTGVAVFASSYYPYILRTVYFMRLLRELKASAANSNYCLKHEGVFLPPCYYEHVWTRQVWRDLSMKALPIKKHLRINNLLQPNINKRLAVVTNQMQCTLMQTWIKSMGRLGINLWVHVAATVCGK